MKRQLARLGGFVAVTALVALTIPTAAAFAADPGPGTSGGGGGGGGGNPAPSSTTCPTITVDPGTGGSGSCNGVTVNVPAQPAGPCTKINTTVTVNPVGAIAVPNPPAGFSQVYAVTVAFTCSNTGQKYTGAFTPTATVTVTNPSIQPGHPIFEFANGTWSQVANATVTAGSATFSVAGDPQFVFYAPAISGATLAVTGKPVVGEGILAGALFALGLLGMWRVARRRTLARA
jgi:hypothetical protein